VNIQYCTKRWVLLLVSALLQACGQSTDQYLHHALYSLLMSLPGGPSELLALDPPHLEAYLRQEGGLAGITPGAASPSLTKRQVQHLRLLCRLHVQKGRYSAAAQVGGREGDGGQHVWNLGRGHVVCVYVPCGTAALLLLCTCHWCQSSACSYPPVSASPVPISCLLTPPRPPPPPPLTHTHTTLAAAFPPSPNNPCRCTVCWRSAAAGRGRRASPWGSGWRT
jgi:hypothetical protein